MFKLLNFCSLLFDKEDLTLKAATIKSNNLLCGGYDYQFKIFGFLINIRTAQQSDVEHIDIIVQGNFNFRVMLFNTKITQYLGLQCVSVFWGEDGACN